MPHLHATLTPEGRLFFWSLDTALDLAVEREVPAVAGLQGQMTRRNLVVAGEPPKRQKLAGFEVEVKEALPVLAALGTETAVSDSLRCWAYAAKLALELSAEQRVVPSVRNGEARWAALLSREIDRERFEALVDALPVVSRAAPTRERGQLRLLTSRHAARAFLDSAVDGLYRQNAYPGSARGWTLEFAQALKSEAEAQFRPRDARYQGIPEMIAGWTTEAEAGGLRVGVSLLLPDEAQKRKSFQISYWLHPAGNPRSRVPLSEAWKSGKSITIDGVTYPHPGTAAITGLARMARVYEPLNQSLHGKAPRDLRWKAKSAWDFLDNGVALLEDAGFHVEIPEEFARAGKRRIRPRIRIDASGMESGEIELNGMLRFTWEVVLGDLILSGVEFAELLEKKSPVVEFRGEWVLLDPAELERLPKGLPQEGELPAAVALRAVLTGQHDGVEVVADGRLENIVDALRRPPEVAPPAGLVGTLRKYQLTGLSWLTTLGQLGLGACLADDMGLGKTIQLIAHILKRREGRVKRGPTLVVCPTSVLGNWTRELARFAPGLRVRRFHGLQRSPDVFAKADVVLTTYGLLVRDAEILGEQLWDVIALDEAQAIKNPDSQRARAARSLKGRHRVAMTGTPVENRLDELWSLMQFLVPGLLGPRATFRRNVAVPIERFGDQDIAKRLKLGVSPFVLRRLKSDPTIIDDLPDKLESVDYCALKPRQAALYREVVEESLEAIRSADKMARRGQVLKLLTALKQVCNHPAHYLKEKNGELTGRSGKLDRLTEILDSIFELGEHVLVFTQYREMGELLRRHLLETYEEEVPFLHGGVPVEKRDAMVHAFQTDDTVAPILLVSLKAGGTGLNLTRATHVIHFDRWWNPAVEDQATDRAYRIGQQRNVQVHKMVSQGTLEERIDAMLEEKRQLAESVIGAGEAWVTELDDDALRALVMLGDDAIEEDE
ncbi:MAG: DEAD/DEAH box helicase [Alphaproteobacteria bacterium]|nr:DEAD/DEAH box helicase [Alphaproteobacteria bacterium]